MWVMVRTGNCCDSQEAVMVLLGGCGGPVWRVRQTCWGVYGGAVSSPDAVIL